jgi:hypothetical protein
VLVVQEGNVAPEIKHRAPRFGKRGTMDNIDDIFTAERRAVLLEILKACRGSSVTITISQAHPASPKDILAEPTIDTIRIRASFTMGAA